MHDFIAHNHGSFWLLLAVTPAARQWEDEHLPEERQVFGNATAVEHRYIADILDGIENDGLDVGVRT